MVATPEIINRLVDFSKETIIFAEEMLYDLIYPKELSEMRDTTCLVAAAVFDELELQSFGVNGNSYDFNPVFADLNEFDKLFALWSSPTYLVEFYEENLTYFEDDYWAGITITRFVIDVKQSLPHIKKQLYESMENNSLSGLAEPLDESEANGRLFRSIRVKFKQGDIFHRFAFRIYAIEIEENTCYLITGGAIKITQQMSQAQNTLVELKKMDYAYRELDEHHVNTKETFIDYLLS